jgi:hypothetical protein
MDALLLSYLLVILILSPVLPSPERRWLSGVDLSVVVRGKRRITRTARLLRGRGDVCCG